MSVCEKHGYDLRYIKECTGCVREERDSLKQRVAGLEERLDWQAQNMVLMVDEQMKALREERDRLRAKLDEAVRLLKRRMHCDICECPGCIEVRKVIEG